MRKYRRKRTRCIAVALIVFVVAASKGNDRSIAEAADVPRCSPFYEDLRCDEADIIQIRGGESLRGTLIANDITIVTEYATLKIPRTTCRWILFDSVAHAADCIVTDNWNLITGIITDRRIPFRVASTGKVADTRKQRVGTILLGRGVGGESGLSLPEQTNVFVMANGDLLTGRFAERELTLTVEAKDGATSEHSVDINTAGGFSVDNAGIVWPRNSQFGGAPRPSTMTITLDIGLDLPDVDWMSLCRVWSDRTYSDVSAQLGVSILREKPTEGDASSHDPTAGELFTNSIGMRFRYVAPGKFEMGSPADERGRASDECSHSVRLTEGFFLGVTEVTQAQWTTIMASNPSFFPEDIRPVECVSWWDAIRFCRILSEKEGRVYRLPTEAEWEYACRAGSETAYSGGSSLWRSQANCDGFGNAADWYSTRRSKSGHRQETTAVGSFKPNKWGFYDMHGNIREWCADWYAPLYDTLETSIDPSGPKQGHMRVQRGGSWRDLTVDCRSARRFRCDPTQGGVADGFRVVLDPDGTPSVLDQASDVSTYDMLGNPLLIANWVKERCVNGNLGREECISQFKKEFPGLWEKNPDLFRKVFDQEGGWQE